MAYGNGLAELLDCYEDEKTVKWAIRILQQDMERLEEVREKELNRAHEV
jgi:hypothetical protein